MSVTSTQKLNDRLIKVFQIVFILLNNDKSKIVQIHLVGPVSDLSTRPTIATAPLSTFGIIFVNVVIVVIESNGHSQSLFEACWFGTFPALGARDSISGASVS